MNRYFANDPHQPRVRRAHDAVVLSIGLVLLVWAVINADRVAAIEAALLDLSQSIPLWFDQVYRIAYIGGFLLIVALFIAVLAQMARMLEAMKSRA